MLTPETGDGRLVKPHRGVGPDKTQGRALRAGTIAVSATDRVSLEMPRNQGEQTGRSGDSARGRGRSAIAFYPSAGSPAGTHVARQRHVSPIGPRASIACTHRRRVPGIMTRGLRSNNLIESVGRA